ncbi:MAG: histidine triad (HIT) family protein [Haloarculaceae archaeon]|jgi:histidine triad (HIT) family protein
MAAAADRRNMSEDCIFCQIVAEEMPSHTVYEDETARAFLDVNPLARGHTVVIPTDHYERVGDMPADVAGGFFQAINEITPAIEAAVDAPATTVAINNGTVAGQEVPHVHCHVVPRFEGDGAGAIHAMFRGADVSDDEMSDLVADIREHR